MSGMDYQWVEEKLADIHAKLERLEAMIPKSVSASLAPEQENKGDSMATKAEIQAAAYRAEAIARAGQFTPSEAPQEQKCTERQKHAAMTAGVVNGFVIAEGAIAMIPKSVSASSAPEQENKGDNMSGSTWFPASEQPAPAPPFAEAAKCSPAVSETGETQSGLRTERVTLEIKQFSNSGYKSPSEWPWEFFLRGEALTHGESVRVVEEPLSNAWCRSPARDEAVRACEDGRPGPLPTLEEAIASASPLPGRVEGTHWADWERLRDERDAAIRDLRSVTAERAKLEAQLESVACRAATAETALEAAPAASNSSAILTSSPAASGAAGRHATFFEAGMPLNFQYAEDSFFPPNVHGFLRQGVRLRDGAAPQPAKGWLTQEEREVISYFRESCQRQHEHAIGNDSPRWGEISGRRAAILQRLLARSSPPEVVLPVSWTETNHINRVMSAEAVIAAIAAAGVRVKEVG